MGCMRICVRVWLAYMHVCSCEFGKRGGGVQFRCLCQGHLVRTMQGNSVLSKVKWVGAFS